MGKAPRPLRDPGEKRRYIYKKNNDKAPKAKTRRCIKSPSFIKLHIFIFVQVKNKGKEIRIKVMNSIARFDISKALLKLRQGRIKSSMRQIFL